MQIPLSQLKPGQHGMVVAIEHNGALRQRLIAMGVTPGTMLTFRRTAPLGDPMEIHLRSISLSLRRQDARHILMEVEEPRS